MSEASITYVGEASESFANVLQYIRGYTVEVVPAEGQEREEPFDAVVWGSAASTVGDYFAVNVQLYDHEAGSAVGDAFNIIVRELRVY